MDFSAKLGKRIKELRVKSRFSQDTLAEQAGISGKYLGEVERGETNVSAAILDRLAKALQVSLADMVCCDHHADRSILQEKILHMVKTASEAEVQLIFRILHSLLR